MPFIALYSVWQILGGTSSAIMSLLDSYGYLAIFLIMTLEYSSLPIPSEVVLPAVGVLAAKGVINIYIAYIVVFFSALVGMSIDYFIAYFLEKEVVYKHLEKFHISKESLESFDEWFKRNGSFAVFIGRLLPEVRGLISLPAGFAGMDKKKFFAYSLAGALIWNAALMAFGYYALSTNNYYITLIAIALFVIVLYVVYKIALKKRK